MQPKVVLIARVKADEGKYVFAPVEIKRGRPVEPQDATTYYLRYSENGKRRVEPVGANLNAAFVEFQNRETQFTRQRAGLLPIPELERTDDEESAASLANTIASYLSDGKATGWSKATISAYDLTLRNFLAVCEAESVHTVEQLQDPAKGRAALIAFLAWMRKNTQRRDIKGTSQDTTFAKRMTYLSAFLTTLNIKLRKGRNPRPDDPGLLRHTEVPKAPKKTPVKYGQKKIQALLAAASVDEADLIHFFIATGFRDEEVAYCEWSDINFSAGTINVHEKPHTASRPWSWKPKDKESRPRAIPLSQPFLARMRERRARMTDRRCALIFPSATSKPNMHLIKILRRVAERAKVEGRVTLHAFRRTFGSMIAKKFGIEVARQLLGHADIATTQLYLAADDDEHGELKAGIGDVMAELVGTE
jgi:integrase